MLWHILFPFTILHFGNNNVDGIMNCTRIVCRNQFWRFFEEKRVIEGIEK